VIPANMQGFQVLLNQDRIRQGKPAGQAGQ
jgi:hypothetical protein